MKEESKQIIMNGIFMREENEMLFISIFDENIDSNLENLVVSFKKNGVVCLTGNRPVSLPWNYNEDCESCLLFKQRLKKLLLKLIESGYTKFISGLAMGFDIIATEILLALRKDGLKIFIEGAVPCLNQTRGWKIDYTERYQYVLDNLDKVTFTSTYAYFEGCYQIRNRYMVDNSNLVLGCQLNKSSGTKSTLDYAKKQQKIIVIINQ